MQNLQFKHGQNINMQRTSGFVGRKHSPGLLLLLVVASCGSDIAAQVQTVSPEDILKAAFDVKKAADAADKVDSDALEYCGSPHRALATSSDVEESISERS